MYIETLIIVLFAAYLIYQYIRTKAVGNLAFLVPMGMMLFLAFPWVNTWPQPLFIVYHLGILASGMWAFWFYLRDFRKREAEAIARTKAQRQKEKAERKAQQKAANAHPNPSKRKRK